MLAVNHIQIFSLQKFPCLEFYYQYVMGKNIKIPTISYNMEKQLTCHLTRLEARKSWWVLLFKYS